MNVTIVDMPGAKEWLIEAMRTNPTLALTRRGVAGHRYSPSEGAWVCDPWTEMVKQAKAEAKRNRISNEEWAKQASQN